MEDNDATAKTHITISTRLPVELDDWLWHAARNHRVTKRDMVIRIITAARDAELAE